MPLVTKRFQENDIMKFESVNRYLIGITSAAEMSNS